MAHTQSPRLADALRAAATTLPRLIAALTGITPTELATARLPERMLADAGLRRSLQMNARYSPLSARV